MGGAPQYVSHIAQKINEITMAKEKDDAPKIDANRQAKWDAFLEEARKVNPVRFDAQKENGEFDVIPNDFV